MPNILYLTNDDPEITRLVTQFVPPGFTLTVQSDRLPVAEQVALLAEADFLIPASSAPPDAGLRAATRLKLIQLMSAGFNHLNLPLCRELGILIANNGHGNAIDVAEHTLAMILGFYRRLFELDRHVRTRQWAPMAYSTNITSLNGRTVGVVGIGQIGRRVAYLVRAFGAQVLYYDQFPLSSAEEATLGVTYAPLPALLRQADIVTLHVNLTPQSHQLIGRAELALLKPTALLVNTCRGPVVDEAALIEVLQTNRILGAALDVLAQEPPDPHNPILEMENVLLSPHMAGNSYDTWSRRGRFMFENIARVWRGEAPLAVVSK